MDSLSASEVAARLLAAFVAGAVIGWERESRGRPAGFRTTILACTAAAVSMLVSEALYAHSAAALEGTNGAWRPDPARLGAGILTGIGFLGAGTIIRHENFVRGVTTAASLWFVTVIGLAVGSGQFAVGAMGMGVAIVTLFGLPFLERYIRSDWYAHIQVGLEAGALSDEALLAILREKGLRPVKMKVQWDAQAKTRTIEVEVKFKQQERFELSSRIVALLSEQAGVNRVSWE